MEPEEITTRPFDNIRLRGNASLNYEFDEYRARNGQADEIEEPGVDFKKIRLRFEVKAVFALK